MNLLKPYYARTSEPASCGAQLDSGLVHAACAVGPVLVESPPDLLGHEDGLGTPDQALLHGRLKNSEALGNMQKMLVHLPESCRGELVQSIQSFPSPFGDTPTCTHLIEHDIDVGDAKPIKQRFYRVNADRQKYFDAEVKYMLENDIAEPCFSSWSSPCLLVPKTDNTPRFSSDFRKVNNVTEPDSFPLPRMDDCIDQVGSAKFVSKFDLLKGYWQVPLSQRTRELPSCFCNTYRSLFIQCDALWSS